MKTAFELSHVKSVTAISLMHKDAVVGKIVANWSDNPCGTVCTATVQFWNVTELLGQQFISGTGKAGGYGYDKLSEAIYKALKEMDLQKVIKVEPASGNQQKAFEEAGFTFVQLI